MACDGSGLRGGLVGLRAGGERGRRETGGGQGVARGGWGLHPGLASGLRELRGGGHARKVWSDEDQRADLEVAASAPGGDDRRRGRGVAGEPQCAPELPAHRPGLGSATGRQVESAGPGLRHPLPSGTHPHRPRQGGVEPRPSGASGRQQRKGQRRRLRVARRERLPRGHRGGEAPGRMARRAAVAHLHASAAHHPRPHGHAAARNQHDDAPHARRPAHAHQVPQLGERGDGRPHLPALHRLHAHAAARLPPQDLAQWPHPAQDRGAAGLRHGGLGMAHPPLCGRPRADR